MSNCDEQGKRTYRVSSNKYRVAREKFAEHHSSAMSGSGNGMFGKHHNEETRQKLSTHAKGNKWCVGRKLSEETKRKIGLGRGFLGKHHTSDVRKRISKSKIGNKNWLGRKHSECTK